MGLRLPGEVSPAPAAWSLVQTDAGTVTLATLDEIRARANQLNDWVAKTIPVSAQVRSEADDHYAACGAILVPRTKDWTVPSSLQSAVSHANVLVDQIEHLDQEMSQLKEKRLQGNIFNRLSSWRHERSEVKDRAARAAQLRALLIQIGREADVSTVGNAGAEKAAAAALDARADAIDAQIHQTRSSVASIDKEVMRRQEAVRAMGFDSLYEAAILQTSGPAQVQSPLLTKSGEIAILAAAATLSRMVTRTHYVGGSSGFSFPIGHTGIRYRVGTFRGQPVQQQALTKLDDGTFVVSNQRLAFVGRTKSVSVPLGKILHLELYSNALAVFQEGKENPDFYMMAQPGRALFLINWEIGNQQAAVK